MTDEASVELYVDDARAEIDWALEGELRRAGPDFAAVVAAAHAAAPEAVSAEAVACAADLPLTLRSAGESGVYGADSLLEAMAAARHEAEADVAARGLRGVPPLRAALAPRRRPSRLIIAAATAAAAAAAAVVIWTGTSLTAASRTDTSEDGTQAEFSERERTTSRAEALRPGREAQTHPQPVATPEPSPPPTETATQEPAREPEASVRRPATPRPSVRDRVAELDAEAQRQWQRGELSRAQGIFREIIEVAPTSRFADLAFGDLFTLARQRGRADEQLALWNEYLERFPSGRFADDARAGVCRASGTPECWRGYLEQFPDGAHKERAAEALDGEGVR